MAGKKILMLVGEFSEEYEIFVFEQAMHAVGHTVHVVCPDKKAGDVLKTSLHDFEGHQTYTEKLGHDYILNKTFSEVRLEDYDAVYCAGGRGPEYIRIDKRVQAMVRHFHDTGKPIFTICHGVQILIAVDGVVRGRQVAALQYCEPEVTLAGGIYIDVAPNRIRRPRSRFLDACRYAETEDTVGATCIRYSWPVSARCVWNALRRVSFRQGSCADRSAIRHRRETPAARANSAYSLRCRSGAGCLPVMCSIYRPCCGTFFLSCCLLLDQHTRPRMVPAMQQ
jgi:protease I